MFTLFSTHFSCLLIIWVWTDKWGGINTIFCQDPTFLKLDHWTVWKFTSNKILNSKLLWDALSGYSRFSEYKHFSLRGYKHYISNQRAIIESGIWYHCWYYHRMKEKLISYLLQIFFCFSIISLGWFSLSWNMKLNPTSKCPVSAGSNRYK